MFQVKGLSKNYISHKDKNSKQINIAKYVSKILYGAKMLDNYVASKKEFLYIVLFR